MPTAVQSAPLLQPGPEGKPALRSEQLVLSLDLNLAEVFGLKYTDGRTVEYEVLGMLNVSAMQALARQMEGVHQQNAILTE